VNALLDETNDLEFDDGLGETALAVDEDEEDDEPVFYHAYQNSAAKAEDNRSSASALLLIGGLGFVLDLLVFTNVIPIYHNSDTSKYLVCGVMGAMFVLFIVFGIVSMRSSKILFKQAEAEDSLKSEMTKWCQENLSAQAVDAGLFEGEELEEEQKYFKRAEKMRKMISDNFLNLDEAFLEHFVDEYYQTLYGEA
jgi:Ca2+/H+ antiporter